MIRFNINNLRYADDTTLMAGSEEELKSLLMKVKEKSEKAGLKFNIYLFIFVLAALGLRCGLWALHPGARASLAASCFGCP